jgi:putative transferase (TIGR04331 family)
MAGAAFCDSKMTTAIVPTHLSRPNDFDNGQHVLLGSWCIADRFDLRESDITSIMVAHPWRDPQRLNDDYTKIRSLYETALKQFTDNLNALHQTDLPERSWELSIGPWLRILINCAYERHMLMELAVRDHDASSILSAGNEHSSTFATTKEFVKNVQDAGWNEGFAAEIARIAFPHLKKISKQTPVSGQQPATSTKASATPRKSAGLSNLFRNLDEWTLRYRSTLLHRTGMPWSEEIKSQLKSGMLPHFYLPELDRPSSEKHPSMRSRLKIKLGRSPIEQILEEILPDSLPLIFVEDFAAVLNLIGKRYPQNPKRIATGVSYYADDYFKIFTAIATTHGAKYGVIQHGGGFGTPELNDEEELQIKTADYILTWGWTQDFDHGHAKTLAKPSIWLSASNDVEHDTKGRIILPVSEWTLQTFRIFSAPLSFRQLDYIEHVARFQKALDPEATELLRIRLQPNTRGWHSRERFASYGLERAILNTKGRFISDLSSSRLAVVNTNSTTLLEALCLNFPTIAYIDPEISPLRDNVKSAFDDLKTARILHDTPEQAAAFVNKVFDNPAEWWWSDATQKVRNSFSERFAMRDSQNSQLLREFLNFE